MEGKIMENVEQTDESRELQLYIENDGNLYRKMYWPILKNYQKKWDKGTFDRELAVKGMYNLALEGAKRYGKEFSNNDGLAIFSVADRKQVAENLVNDFIVEVEARNRYEETRS